MSYRIRVHQRNAYKSTHTNTRTGEESYDAVNDDEDNDDDERGTHTDGVNVCCTNATSDKRTVRKP